MTKGAVQTAETTPFSIGIAVASMDDEDIRLVLLLPEKEKSVVRSTWIRSIFERRRDQGDFHQEMRLGDTESHFIFLRMSKERFDMLLSKVTSRFVSLFLHNQSLLSHMKHYLVGTTSTTEGLR